jgi:hypothetical protein
VAGASRAGGLPAADAIRTTDTVVKIAFRRVASRGDESPGDPPAHGGTARPPVPPWPGGPRRGRRRRGSLRAPASTGRASTRSARGSA